MIDALPWIAVVIAGGAVAWALAQLRVVSAVACGYKAKVLCSAIFASHREMNPQTADEVAADSYWLLRPFRARVEPRTQSVSASFLGLWPRTAVHRPGSGATLVCGDNPHARTEGTGSNHRPTPPLRAWSSMRGSAAVLRIVDGAFDEPNPRRLRRTHAVVVVHDGQIVAERYARGVRADTPLPGWSMTKSVLNALVGILVSEGQLALDQRELLPEWRSSDPRSKIQLEDLLRMRSGLRFSEAYANPWSDALRMLFTSADTAAYAASRPLDAAPGTVWSYSSGTSNILSAIVRRAVGDTYPSWPRQVLFEPLDMPSAVLEPDAAGTFVCSSFMLATARDWARFGQLWLDNGRCDGRVILPEEWIRFSSTPTPQSDGRYGAHWWLKLNPEVGGDDPVATTIAPDALFALGHEGQTLTVIPSKRLVVVRLGASIYIDAWNHAAFIAALQHAF